jgi:hypothetical protein
VVGVGVASVEGGMGPSPDGAATDDVEAKGGPLLRVCLRTSSENLVEGAEVRPSAAFSIVANCSIGVKSKLVRETLS